MSKKSNFWKIIYKSVTFVVLFLIISFSVDWYRAPKQPLNSINIPLTLLDGQHVNFVELSKDKPLIVYFWASWCGFCNVTSPTINNLVNDGANILTVALQSGDDEFVKALMAKKEFTFPVINDPEGTLGNDWKIIALPTIIWIKDGEMRFSTSGLSSSWGIKLRTWLVSWW